MCYIFIYLIIINIISNSPEGLFVYSRLPPEGARERSHRHVTFNLNHLGVLGFPAFVVANE